MDTPKWLKWILGLAGFAIATVALMWLSGFLFILFSKENPVGKTEVLTWLNYYNQYSGNETILKRLVVSLAISAFFNYGIPLIILTADLRKGRGLHGDADFASPSEVKKSGLMCEEGIIVGMYKGSYLVYSGQQFVLLASPTRGGKGVGIVIPNLLNFKDSVVVLDIKQENYKLTAGYRAKYGQKVFLFNPFTEDFRTARYNPLGYVREGDFRISDLISIGVVFFPAASSGTDGFFDDQARNLFVGLGLYLCETPTLPLTLGEMLRQSSGKGSPIKDHIEGIIKDRNYVEVENVDEDSGEVEMILEPRVWDGQGLPPLSMECVDALNRFNTTSDNTRSSILASFNAPLDIWSNPIVDAATSANDFDLRRVRKERISIYIGINPDQLAVAGRLVNLLFSQLINLNTKELPQQNPELKYQCLLAMDEFTAIGRVGIIASANSFMAGYNLRLLTIIQSTAQLENNPPMGYGREDARTLVTNHALQIIFPPRDQDDAEQYSKMLGDGTVKGKSVSRQSRKSGQTISSTDQRRALLLPQEIKEIGRYKQIIMLENSKPIFCDKIRYYLEPTFINRLKEISPSLAKIKGIPGEAELNSAAFGMELAPLPPPLNLDVHKAKIHARIRAAKPSDIAEGIDINVLALDLQKIKPLPDNSEDLKPEEVESFVADFFGSLDVTESAVLNDGDVTATEDDTGIKKEIDMFELVTIDSAAATIAVTNSNDEIEETINHAEALMAMNMDINDDFKADDSFLDHGLIEHDVDNEIVPSELDLTVLDK